MMQCDECENMSDFEFVVSVYGVEIYKCLKCGHYNELGESYCKQQKIKEVKNDNCG